MNGSLQVVTIPDSVTGTLDALARCNGLKAAALSNSLTTVNGFNVCSALWHIVIPEGVTTISNYAYQSCVCVLDIDLPSTLTSIGTGAISGIWLCNRITIRATTPPALANSSAISGFASDCVFVVPRGSLEAYQTATNWSTFANRMMEGDV